MGEGPDVGSGVGSAGLGVMRRQMWGGVRESESWVRGDTSISMVFIA